MCIQESVQTDHDAAPYKNQICQNLCHNHSLFQKMACREEGEKQLSGHETTRGQCLHSRLVQLCC